VRARLFWRFGAVTFAGLGQVTSAIDELSDANLLWSAGLGPRFRRTEKNPLHDRTDIAWGRDGFEFYFSIGEAF
jgi:hypothetical protein